MPTPPRTKAPSDHIRSLSRGLRILDYAHAAGRPVAIKELARGLGLHLATTYHLVNTLIYDGYLERTADRLVKPGRPFGRADSARDVAVQRALGRAAFAVDDVAVMARLAGAQTRVIETAEVPGAPCSGHYDRDATGLSHTLAVGRVILAHQPSEVAEEMIDLTRRAACAQGDLFDEAELRDSLQATAERRFCVVVGDGDACVGAPVLGRDGSVHGAVAVVVEPRRLHRGLDRLVTAASTAAREISTALDHAPGPKEGRGRSETPRER